ncbi:MAG: hypothetical protein AAGJ35_13435, partial [Myxococcota bacterium]
GTTGGSALTHFPKAGYLHHLNWVTVQPQRVHISTLPVGEVFDPKTITPSKFEAICTIIERIQPQQRGVLSIPKKSKVSGQIRFHNPTPYPLDLILTPKSDKVAVVAQPPIIYAFLRPKAYPQDSSHRTPSTQGKALSHRNIGRANQHKTRLCPSQLPMVFLSHHP